MKDKKYRIQNTERSGSYCIQGSIMATQKDKDCIFLIDHILRSQACKDTLNFT